MTKRAIALCVGMIPRVNRHAPVQARFSELLPHCKRADQGNR